MRALTIWSNRRRSTVYRLCSRETTRCISRRSRKCMCVRVSNITYPIIFARDIYLRRQSKCGWWHHVHALINRNWSFIYEMIWCDLHAAVRDPNAVTLRRINFQVSKTIYIDLEYIETASLSVNLQLLATCAVSYIARRDVTWKW